MKFIDEIIKKLEKSKNHKAALDVLFKYVENDKLEMRNGVLFRFEDYTIQNIYQSYGALYEKNLRKLNKFNLNIIPKHIKTIIKENDMFIVNHIEGTKQKFLEPFFINKRNIPKENLQEAFDDLVKLTKEGFVDDLILESTKMWFVAPDNKRVVLPSFEALREVEAGEQQAILEKYHKILF